MSNTLITGAKVSVGGRPPLPSSLGLVDEDWTSLSFRIHDFASLSSTKGHYIGTPEFTCNGHEWQLQVLPGGNNTADEGYVSAYLYHLSEEKVMIDFAIDIIDKFGKSRKGGRSNKATVGKNKSWWWKNFIPRSDILDESKHMLDSDGCLNIVVSIKQDPTTVFVPKHPLLNTIKGMFNDEATADVSFEVSKSIDKKKGKQKKSKSSVSFHAHRSILKNCAPVLADLLGENDSATIADIQPDIFHHLLYHIYGGEVSSEELKTRAKDIIDAADKFAIINLKLKAEAAYVESASITFDNAIGDLLYADSKNCALLKEKVMTFLADHPNEAAEKISFADFPAHVVKDLLIVFGRNSKNETNTANVDELTTLCVSALRRKLYEKGLEVDGSREAMIESIKNSDSNSSS